MSTITLDDGTKKRKRRFSINEMIAIAIAICFAIAVVFALDVLPESKEKEEQKEYTGYVLDAYCVGGDNRCTMTVLFVDGFQLTFHSWLEERIIPFYLFCVNNKKEEITVTYYDTEPIEWRLT